MAHHHHGHGPRAQRRRWTALTAALAATALVAGAAGCGGDDDAASTAETTAATGAVTDPPSGASTPSSAPTTAGASGAPDTSATRSVQTEFGEVEVPVDPQRVVALDEYAALNALAVGIEPILVFATFQSEVGGVVLDEAGIEVQPGSAEGAPNFEAIAAAQPDLILFTTEGALTSNVETLRTIAPAVSLPYTTPWRDVIRATADVFDRGADADRLIDVLDGRIEALHAEVATDPPSMSILADSLGATFSVAMKSPLAQVVEEVGFTRPPVEADGVADPTFDSAVMLSLETLAEHDADLVVVLSGAYYNAQTLLDAPTFQALPAVRDGRSVVVDGDMWFGTYPFAIWWLLDDLTALHDGRGQDGIGGPDDVAARWAAFEEATS